MKPLEDYIKESNITLQEKIKQHADEFAQDMKNRYGFPPSEDVNTTIIITTSDGQEHAFPSEIQLAK